MVLHEPLFFFNAEEEVPPVPPEPASSPEVLDSPPVLEPDLVFEFDNNTMLGPVEHHINSLHVEGALSLTSSEAHRFDRMPRKCDDDFCVQQCKTMEPDTAPAHPRSPFECVLHASDQSPSPLCDALPDILQQDPHQVALANGVHPIAQHNFDGPRAHLNGGAQVSATHCSGHLW